jgi:hypothetical protein
MSNSIVVITAPDYIGPIAELLKETQKLATALIGKIPVSVVRADANQIGSVDALVVISAPGKTMSGSDRIHLLSDFNQAFNDLYPSLCISTLMASTHTDGQHRMRQLVDKLIS